LGWRTQTFEIGVVSVGGWPCGQDSRPRPECRQRRNPAPRGGRREAGLTGFDCRAGWGYFDRADTRLGGRGPTSLNARGFCPSSLPGARNRGVGEALRAMPRALEDWAARRRGELDRDRGSRQFSQAVDAQRRLNTRRPATRTPDAFSSSGPGHWDARSSDVYGGLSMRHSEEPRSAYAPS
jgi:hypothetical protein